LRLHQAKLGVPILFLFLLTWTLPVFSSARAFASQEGSKSALVEGAKKEGKLMWYTSLSAKDAEMLLSAFKKRYPFIKTDLFRTGAGNLLTKIQAEVRYKRYDSDVIMTNGISAEILKKEHILDSYVSPELASYQGGFKDQEGYWADVYILLNVIGYNTKMVSPKEVPRQWTDLLNPRWKGKMSMDTKAYEWLYGIINLMGQEKGIEFVKGLATQNISFRTGRSLNCQLLAAGESQIGIALWNQRLEEMKAQGAPIDWVAIEPVITESVRIGLTANAPHPNAAKLFIDFVLSREGQSIVAKTYRVPVRDDVEAIVPRLKKGLKLMGSGYMQVEGYNKYVKLYNDSLMHK